MKKVLVILLALALLSISCASAENLTSGQRYNINLFLSNFTEQGFRYYNDMDGGIDTAALTEFAINHCWFNRQNRVEWGDYFNGNNVRLPEDQISSVVKKYFGFGITPNHNLDYIDYKNGYYYWEETGGHTNDGFACLTSISYWDYGMYEVYFDIYGGGEGWDNDVCYYTPSEAQRRFPYDAAEHPTGYAIIDTHHNGLNDRDGWTLYAYEFYY